MSRLLALTLVLAALPGAAAKRTVCLVEVTDGSGQASVPLLTQALEAALGRAHSVVPTKKLTRAARAQHLPRRQWASPEGLQALSKVLGFQLGVSARLSFAFGTFTLTVTALDASTGAERAEVRALLTKPRLPRERADDLVASLTAALDRAEPPAVVAPPEPVEPPKPKEGPAAPDEWAQATQGFDSPAGAEASAPSLGESLRLDTTVEVGGRVAFEHFGFFENDDASLLGGRDAVDAALRIKAAHPHATAFASLLARADFVDASRNRFDPEEAWVELVFPAVSVKAGRLLFAWGTGTLYNPSDVLNSVDYRDPLHPEKLGALALKLTATAGPLTFEAAYLPVPEAHRLPTISGISPTGALESRSRWIHGSIDVPSNVPLTFHVGPFAAPSPRPSNSQAAGRVELSVGGADIGVGYGYLIDHFPSPHLEVVPQAGVPVAADVYVDWLYRRLHVVTFDFEKTFGKLRLAGEAVAFFTADLAAKNPRVADPYVVGDLGADLQTGQFFGEQRVHFFVEFAMAKALVGALPTEGLDQLRAPFPLTVLARIAWEVGQDLRLEVTAISSVERFDLLVMPRLEYVFFDRVKARLGVELLAGDTSKGFFGPYRGNSRFVASMEARF